MNITKAYKLSLISPLLIPLLTAPLLFVLNKIASTQTEYTYINFLQEIAGVIVTSAIIDGIPYLILVSFFLTWARNKNETQIKRGLLLLPIFMLPVCLLFIIGVGSLLHRENISSDLGEAVLFYTPFILGFGYSYVALVFGTIWLLKRIGFILQTTKTT